MKRLVLCTAFGCLMSVASARDLGQWDGTNPQIREWFQALMQPDNPRSRVAAKPMLIGRICSKSTATNMLPSSPTPGRTSRSAAKTSTSERGSSSRTTS